MSYGSEFFSGYIEATAERIAATGVEFITGQPGYAISLSELMNFLDDDRFMFDVDGLSTPAHGVGLVYATIRIIADDPRISMARGAGSPIAFAAHTDTDPPRSHSCCDGQRDRDPFCPGHNDEAAKLEAAVEAAIDEIRRRGAATFMDVSDAVSIFVPVHGDETMTIGSHAVGDGTTMTAVLNPANVVLWNCGTAEFLAVVEAVLFKEPRIVLERTTVEHYGRGGMGALLEDYTDDGREEVPLPAIDFDDDLDVNGYEVPTWVPIAFAWTDRPTRGDEWGRD